MKSSQEMKKPYLLIVGECYYPSSGTGDWKECYETREEVEIEIQKMKEQNSQRRYDDTWYEIVDLRDWVN